MKLVSSILAMSIFFSNFAMANDQPAFDEEIFADEEAASEMTWEEVDEEGRIAPAAIIGIIIGAVGLGCTYAKNEGEALARRDRGARKTYNNNRWKIRAGVLAGAGPAGLAILRCFENGLNS